MNAGFSVCVVTPEGAQREISIPNVPCLTVGRDPTCHVVLSSPQVSRFHLRIEHDEGAFRVIDQSANGTVLGSEVVRRAGRLLPQSGQLRVGPYELHVVALCKEGAVNHVSPALRRRIHQSLLDNLELRSLNGSDMDDSVLRPRVVRALERIVASLETEIGDSVEKKQLIAEMTDEVLGLGPLQDLLDDENISEIMVVDPNTIYVERKGKIDLTSLRFSDEESCRAAIERIVTPLGRRIDESTPMVDARLKDGSRVNAIIPPLALRGPCITIRKFSRRPLQMPELVSLKSLSPQMASFLQRCVRAKKNILISGGTGSGKTTLLNVLSGEIPATERIITIEDAAELQLDQPHVVALESKPTNLEGQGAYTIRDLVKNALRMRPDRILVGECRAGEAIDMLQAMNTGHEGSMTTTHANSAKEALKRIETLCLMAGLDLSSATIRQQIASSIHVIVQQTRLSDGSRRLTAVTEVGSLTEEGDIALHDIFVFDRIGVGLAGDVIGEHRSTGYVPSFIDEFIRQGLIDDRGYL
ncbi:MAG: ATPase, T2SS/T4P/T4SS family [Polyangiales bacterium]